MSDETDIELQYLKEEQRIEVNSAIKKLKTEYAQVLYLMYFEDFSTQEIANIMSKNKKQIGNLVFRAKKLLKKNWKRRDLSMKNSKEILDTVLKMRDEYYTKKKRRRNLAVRFSALVPVAVVILININSKPPKDIAMSDIDIAEDVTVTAVQSASTVTQHTNSTAASSASAASQRTTTASDALTAADPEVVSSAESETSVQSEIPTEEPEKEQVISPQEQDKPAQTATEAVTEVEVTTDTAVTETATAPFNEEDIDFYVVISNGFNNQPFSGGNRYISGYGGDVKITFTKDNHAYIEVDGTLMPPLSISDEDKEYYRRKYIGKEVQAPSEQESIQEVQ